MVQFFINIFMSIAIIPLGLWYFVHDLRVKPDRTMPQLRMQIEQPGGTWEKLPQLPTDRYEFGADRIGNTIYVVGGQFLATVYAPSRRMEAYDIIKKTWRQVADIPQAIHHPGVATLGETLYVVGGNHFYTHATNAVFSYDPKTNEWTRKKNLPVKRAALGLVPLNGKLYAFGGSEHVTGHTEAFVYDPDTDVWSNIAPLPVPREHLASAVIDGVVYAIGGHTSHWLKPLTTVFAYDPKMNTWSEKAPLPIPLSGMDATGYEGKIYVLGGQQRWAVSPYSFAYDPVKNRWSRKADMSTARYAGAVVAGSDGIHLLGGDDVVYDTKFFPGHDLFHP